MITIVNLYLHFYIYLLSLTNTAKCPCFTILEVFSLILFFGDYIDLAILDEEQNNLESN